MFIVRKKLKLRLTTKIQFNCTVSKFQTKDITQAGLADILRPNGLRIAQLTPEIEEILRDKVLILLSTPSEGPKHVLDYAYVKEWLHKAAFQRPAFSKLLNQAGWRPDILYLAKAGRLKYAVKGSCFEIEVLS